MRRNERKEPKRETGESFAKFTHLILPISKMHLIPSVTSVTVKVKGQALTPCAEQMRPLGPEGQAVMFREEMGIHFRSRHTMEGPHGEPSSMYPRSVSSSINTWPPLQRGERDGERKRQRPREREEGGGGERKSENFCYKQLVTSFYTASKKRTQISLFPIYLSMLWDCLNITCDKG